jgi:hypothetical protein
VVVSLTPLMLVPSTVIGPSAPVTVKVAVAAAPEVTGLEIETEHESEPPEDCTVVSLAVELRLPSSPRVPRVSPLEPEVPQLVADSKIRSKNPIVVFFPFRMASPYLPSRPSASCASL